MFKTIQTNRYTINRFYLNNRLIFTQIFAYGQLLETIKKQTIK